MSGIVSKMSSSPLGVSNHVTDTPTTSAWNSAVNDTERKAMLKQMAADLDLSLTSKLVLGTNNLGFTGKKLISVPPILHCYNIPRIKCSVQHEYYYFLADNIEIFMKLNCLNCIIKGINESVSYAWPRISSLLTEGVLKALKDLVCLESHQTDVSTEVRTKQLKLICS